MYLTVYSEYPSDYTRGTSKHTDSYFHLNHTKTAIFELAKLREIVKRKVWNETDKSKK